ncbi:MAG TPA: PepSY-associated TM helix domain-containing protein [Gammaproteobacteria bacterium]
MNSTTSIAATFSVASLRAAGIVLHRWLGLSVGLVFVVAGLSGALLAYAPEITGELFPVIDGPAPSGWERHRVEVLDRTQREHAPGEVTLIRFPNREQGAYELYLADDTLEYRDAVSGEIVLTRTPFSDVLSFSRELHTHLLAGHAGERVLGWLGIAMLVLTATGLWLWWPRFGAWRFAFRRPRSRGLSPQLFWWHKTVGLVSLATLFFVTLTGVAMVFYYPAQAVLTALLGGEAPEVPQTIPAGQASVIDWDAVITNLDETLPEGRTVFFYPPATPDDVLLFRKQMPGELHPNGRSFIAMTPGGDVMHANDATQLGAGVRAAQAIYPLHAGKAGSETWRFVVFLMGLVPSFFFVTGLWMWRLQRRRLARASRAA